jgi:5-methylcytosine-specific restriction enzyme subunit McrC
MSPNAIVCFEFDKLVASVPGAEESKQSDVSSEVQPHVFNWLESEARYNPASGRPAWIRPSRQQGAPAVEFTSYVGVVRAPAGTQIEILPKIGKSSDADVDRIRRTLLAMLSSLPRFRHILTDNAALQTNRMPLLDVFIYQFLQAVQTIVKRGLRGGYSTRQDNLFALRGKLQVATHLRVNLIRRERFFSEFDEFSTDRAENRLIHTALKCALSWSSSPINQHLARELCFVFCEVPVTKVPAVDFQLVDLDRDMGYYASALAWATLILQGHSPLTGSGKNEAPSMLFPMQDVFEAYVAKHLKAQLNPSFSLQKQPRSLSLVRYGYKDKDEGWFQLKPDLLVKDSTGNRMVLDTKWKLIDMSKDNSRDKFGLSQADFYQMYAYGQTYLQGDGDIVLIYPKTADFDQALKVFKFPESEKLRLWVLPFCLDKRFLIVPNCGSLNKYFYDLYEKFNN